MDLKGKDIIWLNANLDNLPDNEYKLSMRFDRKHDFLVKGNAIDKIEDMAKIHGYETITVNLKDVSDLKGETITATSKEGIPYFYYHVAWADPIEENPDTNYLVIFNIDNADARSMIALKSIAERHDVQGKRYDNMLVCAVCSDKDKVIPKTLIDVLKPVITW